MLRVSQILESLVQFVTYIPHVKKKNCIWVVGGGSVAKLCPAFVTLRTVAHQAPLSMAFLN